MAPRILLILGLALASAACSTASSWEAREEPLYLALEVRENGRLVAQPQFLAATGRPLRAERRSPGALQRDYQLSLMPSALGEGFQIELDLALPQSQGRGEVTLLHGQQRQIQLGKRPGQLTVSVMVMRVDSPEFRALMNLDEAGQQPASVRAI